MNQLEEFAKQSAFTDLAEFDKMVACVDLSSTANIVRFKSWQNDDGSKAGLENVIKLNKIDKEFQNQRADANRRWQEQLEWRKEKQNDNLE